MNKTQFIDYTASQHSITKTEAAKVISLFTASVEKALSSGEETTLPGFGSFCTKKVPERSGVNPRTEQKITIAACVQPKFKASKTLKEACNC